jgi:prophage maintenance system killer protein
MTDKGQIVIYKAKDGRFTVDVMLTEDTVWLTQKQVALLFGTQRPAITKHLKNIFKSKELNEKTVSSILEHTAKDGKIYKTQFYNLDTIISVGYRVNSTRATQFRIWATRVLKEHLLKGYSLNQKRLAETGAKELENALQFIKNASGRRQQLTNEEAHGLIEVIAKYAKSWLLLKSYDENHLPTVKGQTQTFSLSYDHAQNAISQLKQNLIAKKEASNLFGNEREQGLQAILGNLEQSFGGEYLYPTLEEKAAHLLYFIIKDHPFSDGNKRIASLLFIHYLDRNNCLYKKTGETIINDNTLVALALLIAESEPKNKDLMIDLTKNLLNDGKQ